MAIFCTELMDLLLLKEEEPGTCKSDAALFQNVLSVKLKTDYSTSHSINQQTNDTQFDIAEKLSIFAMTGSPQLPTEML